MKSKFWRFIGNDPSQQSFWHRLGAGVTVFLIFYVLQLYSAIKAFSVVYYSTRLLRAFIDFFPFFPIFLAIIAIALDEMFLSAFPLSDKKKYSKISLFFRGALGALLGGGLAAIGLLVFF